jgi:hypothetical protein
MPYLPSKERARVLAEAVRTAPDSADLWVRSATLAARSLHLASQERARVIEEAIRAARLIPDEGRRSASLAALAPYLREHDRAAVLEEALKIARAITDEEARSRALMMVTPRLVARLLPEALRATREIAREGPRSRALAGLALPLTGLSSLDLSSLWLETLPFLAARTRRDVLADLQSLTQVLSALAAPNASTELREVACAITDVARWWP